MWLLMILLTVCCHAQTNKLIDLFYVRHVESQWNCYSNLKKKGANDAALTAAGCSKRKTHDALGRLPDAQISEAGSKQLQEIYSGIGHALGLYLKKDPNGKFAANAMNGGKTVQFMTSNLRRAQVLCVPFAAYHFTAVCPSLSAHHARDEKEHNGPFQRRLKSQENARNRSIPHHKVAAGGRGGPRRDDRLDRAGP